MRRYDDKPCQTEEVNGPKQQMKDVPIVDLPALLLIKMLEENVTYGLATSILQIFDLQELEKETDEEEASELEAGGGVVL